MSVVAGIRLLAAGLALATGLTLAGCSPATNPSTAQPVAIATTTVLGSVLGDITACAGTTSATLMAPGEDPHTFAVSSDQVASLVRAKLVVANGLGLEEALAGSLASAQKDGARILEVAPLIDPLPFGTTTGQPEAHGGWDPHFWLDAHRMAVAATRIGDELATVTGEGKYKTCGAQVSDQLGRVDEQVRSVLAVVPRARRVLVTDHEAFAYFAKAYDFEVAGVVVPGGSTDAEPSSADLAALVTVIRNRQVPAIFSNTAVSAKLVESVAREVGRDVKVVALYEGSVGPKGSGAETYATMMTTNARLIADALK